MASRLIAMAAGILAASLSGAAAMGSGPAGSNAPAKGGGHMDFRLTSTAFEDGQTIPAKHTGDGADASPPLQWTEPPQGTRAFVVICDDPDAPGGVWVHWVLYDLPDTARSLPENVAKTATVLGSAKQGLTDFRRTGYWGPAPPPGRPHRYSFRVYAVDHAVALPAGATKKQVLKAAEGHVLATAELMGKYGR